VANPGLLWAADPAHLSVVASILERTRSGRGQVLVVEGRLGTGRTSLLDQVQRLALEGGTPVLRARGDRSERVLPFGVIRQLVHGLSLAPPATATSRQARAASVESAAWRLVDLGHDSASGLMLVVDDADQSDEASLSTLCAVALRSPSIAVTVVVATGTACTRPGLDRLRSQGTVVRLGPLSSERATSVVCSALPQAGSDYVGAVLATTGGLPLILAAVLADPPPLERLRHDVPSAVRHRVRALLAERGPQARGLAEAVAVLGPGAELGDAGALAGIDPADAGRAADALAGDGLLEIAPRLAFAQPPLANAVLDDLAVHALSALHERAARLGAERDDPDVVDGHLLLTQPSGDAWVAERLVEAAARAEERNDPASVVAYLSRAAAEPPPPACLPGVLLRLAGARITLGDAGAASNLQRLLRLSCTAEDRMQATRLLAELSLLQGDRPAGLELVEDGLDGADLDDPARGALVSHQLTISVLDARYRSHGDRLLNQLTAAARAGSLPRDPGVAAHVALRLAWEGAATDLVQRAVDRAFSCDPLVDRRAQGSLLGFAVRALLATDQLDEAGRVCTEALEAAWAGGMAFGIGYASYHRGLVRLETGELDAALADLDVAGEPAARGWRAADPWRGELQARVHLARGDLAAAREAIRLADGTPATSLALAFVLDARARLALAEGRPRDALDLARRSGSSLAAVAFDTPVLVPWRHVAAQAAYALQRPQQARRLGGEAVATARLTRSAAALGAALTVAGEVSPAKRAVPLLSEACEVLRDSPARPTHARALVDLGRALRQTGRRAEARETLRHGLAAALSLRTEPLIRLARSELVASGARPRREAVTGPGALTPSERRVADLAVTGRTNASIADELCVSLKTVETHLGQTYRKLAISGRSGLAEALGERFA
jgi:DNA-binding CsgD family transcriptional regulator